MIAVDIASICFGGLTAATLNIGEASSLNVAAIIDNLAIASFAVFCLSTRNQKDGLRQGSMAFILSPLMRITFCIAVAAFFPGIIEKISSAPSVTAYSFALMWLAFSLSCSVGARMTMWHLLHLQKGHVKGNVAVVGAGRLGAQLTAMINDRFSDQIAIAGIYDDRRTRLPRDVCGFTVEPISSLQALVRQNRVDKVLVALPLSAEDRLLEILVRLKSLPVDVSLVPDGIGLRLIGQGEFTSGGIDRFLLNILHRPMTRMDLVIKRIFDLMVSAALLFFFAPVMLLAAAAIVMTSRGPVFFRQPRAGLYDDTIDVFKFRTMYVHRTDMLAQQQTLRDDPRVTKVGHFLRKTSIDELPQLFNVLLGQMSLVGPRPHAMGMQIDGQLCHEILREYAQRHRVKPGITGWAQISGFRGAVTDRSILMERVRHDVYYIDNWSIWFDVEILLKTLPEMLFSKNAY